MKLISERNTTEIAELERRLVEFYNTSSEYPAFQQPSAYPSLWREVLNRAQKITASRGSCRILEIGSGRSGFGPFLRSEVSDTSIHLTSQDITATNVDYLCTTSDAVITHNIDQLEGTWDIIFHSYVYEHLCRPQEFNESLWNHLAPGGYLLIQSPRYDIPFYLPPCLDHLPFLANAWRLLVRNVVSVVDSRSRFTIFSDPAVFHMPFRIDRDVVHLVRKSDIQRQFAKRAEFTDFSVPAGGIKDWIVKTLLTLRIALFKRA